MRRKLRSPELEDASKQSAFVEPAKAWRAAMLELIAPLIVVSFSVLVMVAMFSGVRRVRFGSLHLEFDKISAETRRVLDRIPTASGSESASQKQYALLREYHAQGIAQSKISFWVSIVGGIVGFLMILTAIAIALLQGYDQTQSFLWNAAKPGLTLVSGTIMDAVAALFFV
jgi:hypothetical protein